MTADALDPASAGRLAENIIYFCHALRRAGIPVGTAQVQDTIRAVEAVGFTRRADFFVTLRACLITRAEHLDVFSQIFHMFWRDPEILERMITNLLPVINAPRPEASPKPAQNRAAEAMAGAGPQTDPVQEREEIELDAQFSFSQNEVLKQMDFEAMTNTEVRAAERAIAALNLPLPKLMLRRTKPALTGPRIDARAALRRAMRTGGDIMTLPRKTRKAQPINLVVLCDISGSMSAYSRMMMHFIHSVAVKQGADWARVHAFTFGTRLTNITRSLSLRDPDAALNAIGQHVNDWKGGTKIGACLKVFHKDWSRRVLGTSSVVLLITDGLERHDPDALGAEMRRLRLSCRHIIWLNPLLRWDGFEPQAAGIRAILPHVNHFAACHNVASLEELAHILSTNTIADTKDRMMARL